ncbi:hypothetical protein B0H17DRAFT_1009308, partial [Mycena rosella]
MALEAIGTVASILQLVDTALRAREYIQDFRHAPQEQQKLLAEMDNLKPLLVELQQRISGSTSSGLLQQMQNPLNAFETTMERFSKTLEPVDGQIAKFSKRFIWSMGNKKEAKEYLLKFEEFKSLLSSWVLLDIWDANQQHKHDHGDLLQAVSDADQQQRRDHEDILNSVRVVNQQQQRGHGDILSAVNSAADRQESGHDRILTSVDDIAQDQRLHIDTEQRKKLIDWLSPINFFLRQANIAGACQPGTGKWVLMDERFKRWESSAGGILWCCGIPGAGKTFMASIVVDYLSTKSEAQNIGVACMYLNHKETEAQTPSNLIASAWRQLVFHKDISSLAQELYQDHSEKGTRPSLGKIHAVLRSAVTEWSKIYVVVDALDEYPEDERHILLEHLAALGPTVNLMLTSRPHISLHDLDSFRNLETIKIRATEEDVRKYLDEQIRVSQRLSKHVKAQPSLRAEIVSSIVGRVDGVFLLATLHIESLWGKPTPNAVREALKHLPTNLQQTYDAAMQRIADQGEDDRKIAHLALTWVANAKRLLTVQELREALAIELGTNHLDLHNLLDIEIIVSICAGLVIIDSQAEQRVYRRHTSRTVYNVYKPRVRLVHYTTQHYLDNIQANRFAEAQTHITHTLLTALDLYPFDQGRQVGILDYCGYCLVHAAGQPEINLRELIVKFLGQATYRFKPLWSQSAIPPWDFPYWPAYTSPLWMASAANLLETATHLISLGTSTKLDCGALHVATFYGHLHMVQLLIDKGANVNAPDKLHCRALHRASEKGHEQVVRLLIEKGAE